MTAPRPNNATFGPPETRRHAASKIETTAKFEVNTSETLKQADRGSCS